MRVTEAQLRSVIKNVLKEQTYDAWGQKILKKQKVKTAIRNAVKMPGETAKDIDQSFVDEVESWLRGFTSNSPTFENSVLRRTELFNRQFGYQIKPAAMKKMMAAIHDDAG